MVNQRDRDWHAEATVALASRTAGLPVAPPVPIELARKSAQMFARHNELSNQARG
jgi:hypothetical protein